MISGKMPAALAEISFDELLDTACERLMNRQIQHSIRRIQEMEDRLSCLERELDEFLCGKSRG